MPTSMRRKFHCRLQWLLELQLEAALKLGEHRALLTPAEQRRLDECLARAYAAVGQIRRGIEIYEDLLKEAPRDGPLLTAYAELLTRCGNTDCLKKAAATWRKHVSAFCRTGSGWISPGGPRRTYSLIPNWLFLRPFFYLCRYLPNGLQN